jgi:alkyldihydroxyacetonephosphate synthase
MKGCCDMVELEHALTALLGEGAVLSSDEDLAAHAYDGWPVAAKWRAQGKSPLRPDLVVRPQRVEDVARVVAWASDNHVSITPWGAGSSVTGAPLPLQGGLTLDLSALNRTLAINEANLTVTVEAGRMGHELEAELNARGYTLNHSPQSLDRSTVGGWLSTRATGQFSSRWGGIEDLVTGFEVVLPDGRVVQFATGPRMAVGPDLRHLFLGAEGTMGVITKATLKIFRLPAHRIFETVVFPSIEQGLNVMHEIMQRGLRPFLVRFYNPAEARHALKTAAFDQWVMFLGFEGERAVAEAEFEVAKGIWEPHASATLGPVPVERWMDRRFDFSTVENLLKKNGGLAETIEVAHFWDGIEDTYHRLVEALAPYADEVLGHFSHVYPQGTSLYVILLGQCATDADAEMALLQIWQTAMRICMDTGAAISHHHGVGVARMEFVSEALGSAMPVLRQVKHALDPADLFCPGKLGITPV